MGFSCFIMDRTISSARTRSRRFTSPHDIIGKPSKFTPWPRFQGGVRFESSMPSITPFQEGHFKRSKWQIVLHVPLFDFIYMYNILSSVFPFKLVSSADWSEVHHVTNGILCNDWWWRQPVIIRLSRPVIIYARASYRSCTASIAYTCRIRIRTVAAAARFIIIVEWANKRSWAFNSSKSREKNAEEFVKLRALIRITR